MEQPDSQTSWEEVDKWYHQMVGTKGHYYHQHVIIPNLLQLFDFESYHSPSLLDLACGQGVLAHHLPKHVEYVGVDLSPALIQHAKKQKYPTHSFHVADICKPLPIKEKHFTHASIVLALQNVAHPEKAIKQAANHLVSGGTLSVVLNHPCFRIPRQTHWGVDHEKKLQYRRVDRYMTPLKIPIQMSPGRKQKSETTWSFHHSLSDFSRFFAEAEFVIILIDEWRSDKISSGRAARMENLARQEFPLFLTFLAQKVG